MINQQLTEYIQQQKAAGTQDSEIKKRLLESGWESSDIEEGYKAIVQETTKPVREVSPVIPEIAAESIPITPAVTGLPKEYEKQGPRTLVILIIIAVLAGFLGTGTWIIYRNFSKNVSIINPSEETVPSNTPIPMTPTGKLYENSVYGFTIQTPQDWKTEENGTTGVIVNLINQNPESDNGNRFATNINIVSESSGGLSLTDYVSLSKKVLNESFTNYNIISEKDMDFNGNKGILIEATYEMGVYQLHNLQMFIINTEKSFVITATTLNTAWNGYKEILETAVLSFALK